MRAMVADEVASALTSPGGGGVNFCASSAGDVGVETVGNFDLRRRLMTGVDG